MEFEYKHQPSCRAQSFWLSPSASSWKSSGRKTSQIFLLSVISGRYNSLIISMNSQKDSVVNFLTPTKLITGSLKPKPKNHQNDSLFSLSSNKQKPSIPVDDHFKNQEKKMDKFNYGFNRSQQEVEVVLPDPYTSRQKYNSQYNRNEGLQYLSKPALRSENNFRVDMPDKIETRSQYPPQNSFILHKVQVNEGALEQPVYQTLIQNSAVQQNLKASSIRDNREAPLVFQTQRSREYHPGANYQGLNELIMQLRAVKDTIETSLSELQYILDNTSKFLQNIDQQYARIKQRILDYTSQALDAGFTKYRQNMVNWSKYEEVELKTKLIIQQLQKTIKEDEVMVQELNKLGKGSRIIFSKQTQLGQKIELYTNFVSQLQNAKVECLSMRPQLKRDKILVYEEALTSLADF